MNSEEKQGFTVVDKRGQNATVQEKPIPVASAADSSPAKERSWESLGYLIGVNQGKEGMFIYGRVAGLATDGEIFTADYMFGGRWEAGFDWTIDAKRRLDTYLTCSCSAKKGHCSYHRRMDANGGWLKEDMDRIKTDGQRQVPKVIEVLFRAERDKKLASKIISPSRR